MILHGRRFILTGFTTIAIMLLFNCSGTDISKGGLETTNGFITASSFNGTISGFGKPGTRLTLCSPSYRIQDPSGETLYHSTVDNTGAYTIDQIPEGTYNLFCWYDNKQTSIFIPEVSTNQNGPLFNDTLLLTSSHSVSGSALLGENIKDSITVALTGTPLWTMTDKNSSYTIRNVPDGQFTLYASLTMRSAGYTIDFEGQNDITVSTGNLAAPTVHLWQKQDE